jgi:flagellar motility protein MotE (MotC chaperone)
METQETEKKVLRKKKNVNNEKIINEIMLEFIVYHVEKLEMKCKEQDICTDSNEFNKKITKILKEHENDCFLKIKDKIQGKIHKKEQAELMIIYTKMYKIILENRIED